MIVTSRNHGLEVLDERCNSVFTCMPIFLNHILKDRYTFHPNVSIGVAVATSHVSTNTGTDIDVGP